MPSRRLSPRVAPDVQLSATITRNLLTSDAAPVIEELRALAGDDHELMAEVAGRVSGYYSRPGTRALRAALTAEIAGAGAWVPLGQERRSAPIHGARRREVDRPRYIRPMTEVYDVSGIGSMSDADLADRLRQLARIERAEFHANLTSRSFIGHTAHHSNPPLEDARWAVEKELKRRGIWPLADDS